MILFLTWLACGGGALDDATDTEATDADTNDTVASDTDEAGSDTEVDETCPEWSLYGHFALPDDVVFSEGDVSIGVMPFDLSGELSLADLEAPQWLASGILDDDGGSFTLCLPAEVDPEDLVEGDNGEEYATWIVGAWQDDGDGEPGEDDVYVGLSLDLLTYVATSSEEVEAAGAEVGWNLLLLDPTVGITGAEPLSDGEDALVIPGNLLEARPTALSATFAMDHDEDVRVDLYHISGFTEDLEDASLASVAAEAYEDNTVSWDLEEPPEHHLSDSFGEEEVPGLLLAPYAGLVYVDKDGDEALGWDADTLVGSSLGDAQGRLAVYIRATGWSGATIGMMVGHLGWVLFPTGEEDITDLMWEDGLVLEEG